MQDQKTGFFQDIDLKELLTTMGFTNEEIHVQDKPLKVLLEVGNNFIEEILDQYAYRDQEVTIENLERTISAKFPEVMEKKAGRSVEVLQKRYQEIEKIDERIMNIQSQ